MGWGSRWPEPDWATQRLSPVVRAIETIGHGSVLVAAATTRAGPGHGTSPSMAAQVMALRVLDELHGDGWQALDRAAFDRFIVDEHVEEPKPRGVDDVAAARDAALCWATTSRRRSITPAGGDPAS